MKKAFYLILLLLLLGAPAWAEQDHEDHEELRALLKGATEAVNGQKFETLKDYFHPDLRVTTVNQEVIDKPEGLEAYFRSWIGPDKYCLSMNMTMEADELTEFYGEGKNRFGVARGKGVENYDLADGRHLTLDTRWTATVVKDDQGKWKILALHLGTNFYDNQIVHQFQKAAKTYPVVAGLVGLLVGAGLTFLALRKK